MTNELNHTSDGLVSSSETNLQEGHHLANEAGS